MRALITLYALARDPDDEVAVGTALVGADVRRHGGSGRAVDDLAADRPEDRT